MENLALFLDEDLNQIGKKKFESTEEFITFKKGTFNIRLNAFLYRDNNTIFYAYIYPTDEKMLLDVRIEPIKDDKNSKDKDIKTARILKIKEKIEKGDLKLIVGESIIGQLARIAVMGLKTNWVLILIISVAVGIGAGGSMYSFGLNNGINQGFMQAQNIINSTITNILPTPLPSNIPNV